MVTNFLSQEDYMLYRNLFVLKIEECPNMDRTFDCLQSIHIFENKMTLHFKAIYPEYKIKWKNEDQNIDEIQLVKNLVKYNGKNLVLNLLNRKGEVNKQYTFYGVNFELATDFFDYSYQPHETFEDFEFIVTYEDWAEMERYQ